MLNISADRVLRAKVGPIKEAFEALSENSSPVNTINFINNLMSQSKDVIHENLSYLYKLPQPSSGLKLFDMVIEVSNDFKISELEQHKIMLENYISTLDDETTVNLLRESVKKIDDKLTEQMSTEKLREDISMRIFDDRIRQTYVEESYLEDELEIIAYNINYNYEVIDDYELIVRKIRSSDTTEYFSSYPMLLDHNTTLLLKLEHPATGDVLKLFTCMPGVITEKLIDHKASKSTIKTIIKVFDKQVSRITKHLKTSEKNYFMLKYYLGELRYNQEKLNNYISGTLHECYAAETIADMQPDIINYDTGSVINDPTANMDEEFEVITNELEDSIVELLIDDSDEVDPALLEQIIRLSRSYEIMCEAGILNAVERGAVKVSQKVAKGSQKVANSMRSGASTVKRVATAVKFSAAPIVNMVNNTIDKIKKMDQDERTERIITGKRHITLIGTLRKAIMSLVTGAAVVGGAAALATAPAMGWAFIKSTGFVGSIIVLIGILAGIAINKKLDLKERKRILGELESELKIIDEKIDDAKSDGDKKAKYELMRVKNKLEKDIQRVKYNLKD